MLKELFDLVRNQAQETVVNNPEVPNEHNDDIVAEATNTVASGLRNVVAGGGTSSLLNLFNQGGNEQGQPGQQSGIGKLIQNPIVAMMIGHFASKLMSKYKLGGTQANSVANSLIPGVISSLVSQNSGGGGLNIGNLLNSITGGQAGQVAQNQGLDIGSLISQFTGGGQQQSGGGGLMDIVSQLAGGAQQQQQKNDGGGLMDLIKGFIR